jgi:hypothetical protein
MRAHKGWPGGKEGGCDMLPTHGVGGSVDAGRHVQQVCTATIGPMRRRADQLALCLDSKTQARCSGRCWQWHTHCLTGVAKTCGPCSDIACYIGSSRDAGGHLGHLVDEQCFDAVGSRCWPQTSQSFRIGEPDSRRPYPPFRSSKNIHPLQNTSMANQTQQVDFNTRIHGMFFAHLHFAGIL